MASAAVGGRCSLVFALVACVVLQRAPARAQLDASRKAAAEALFDRGVAGMKAGRFAEACVQLEQSQMIERGLGTMLYLAACYESLGRLASAWALFREVKSAAEAEGQMLRSQRGAERAALLEPRLPLLIVRVAPDNRAPNLGITLNGVELPSAAWGAPVPVDPGDIRVDVVAPGYRGFSTQIVAVADGDPRALLVPPLVREPHARETLDPSSALLERPAARSTHAEVIASDRAISPAPALGAARQFEERVDAGESRWQRPAAVITGSVGLIGLGVGTYFGLRAISHNQSAQELCPGSGSICEDRRGLSYSENANDAAVLANSFLIGGALLAATGAVLWLTAPDDSAPTVSLSGDARRAGVQLRGKF